MKKIFILISLISNIALADESMDRLTEACLKDETLSFCKNLKEAKKDIESEMQIIGLKLAKEIDQPKVAVLTAFLAKSLVEQKFELNSNLSQLGNPSLRLEPSKTSLNFNVPF